MTRSFENKLVWALLVAGAVTAILQFTPTQPTRSSSEPASSGNSGAIATAKTYYVAPAALTRCRYNGGAIGTCTPSDSNGCTTQAAPCATLARVAVLLQGRLLEAVVTIQLADTTGGTCYRPDGVLFDNIAQGAGAYNIFEVGWVPTKDTYPTGYIYLKGNLAAPANVIVTGARTCAGTSPAAPIAIRVARSNFRVSGIQWQYFGKAGGTAGTAAVFCSNFALCYLDGPMKIIGNGTDSMRLLYVSEESVGRLGGPMTFSEASLISVDTLSFATTRTPSGWLSLTVTNDIDIDPFVDVAEMGHFVMWGPTSFRFQGSAAYTAFIAGDEGRMTLVHGPVLGASSIVYNAPRMTAYAARQDGFIQNPCGAYNNNCTFAALGKLAEADSFGRIEIGTPGYAKHAHVAHEDTATNGGLIYYAKVKPPALAFRGSSGVITFQSVSFANLPDAPVNGMFLYCVDCKIANPCAAGGTGAFAKRLGGVWVCN